MNKNISIVGCGRLGLAFALLCERAGYNVMACDVREDYVESLNNKTFETVEPYVNDYLREAKNFEATTDIYKAFDYSDLIFCFVPTPSLLNGEYDHSHIEEVVNELWQVSHAGRSLDGKAFIICSTVMPTYCKKLQQRLEPYGITVIYNPFFIAQGSICNDIINADFILLGGITIPADLTSLYFNIMDNDRARCKIMSHTAAEITKIALNCFLTTKISFANMIAEIVIQSGEEQYVKNVLDAIGSDSRVGNKFFNYGFGYAGLCLPRDGRALGIHGDKVGVDTGIQKAVDKFNNQHLSFIKEKFKAENHYKKPFVFNQLSYKKGVDIITESQHYQLCKELLQEGCEVVIFESDAVLKMVKPELEKYNGQVTYGDSSELSRFPERANAALKRLGILIEL